MIIVLPLRLFAVMTVLAGATGAGITASLAADAAEDGYLAVGVGLQRVDTASREQALRDDSAAGAVITPLPISAGPNGAGSALETSSVERSNADVPSTAPVTEATPPARVVIEKVPPAKPSLVTVKKSRAVKSVARRATSQAPKPDKETATKLIARGMDTGLNISHIEAPGED